MVDKRHRGPTRPGRARPASASVAVVVSVTLIATACSSRIDGEVRPLPHHRTPSTTNPLSTIAAIPLVGPMPTDDPELRKVAEAYVAAFTEFARAFASGNADAPALAAFETGDALAAHRATLRTHIEAGESVRPADPSHAGVRVEEVRLLTDTTAYIKVCEIDDFVVFGRRTGTVIDPAAAHRSVEANESRADGSWRVSSFEESAERAPTC